MKKRILALLLCLCMLFSCLPSAFAAPAPVDDTADTTSDETGTDEAPALTPPSFDEDGNPIYKKLEHDDLDFSEIEANFTMMNMEDIQAELDAISALKEDAANTDKIFEMMSEFIDTTMQELVTNYTILNIQTSNNTADEEAGENLVYYTELYDTALDSLYMTLKGILESPCEKAVKDYFPDPEDWDYLLNYEPLTEEQIARSAKITELELAYNAAYTPLMYEDAYDNTSVGTVNVNGTEMEMTLADLVSAYNDGSVTRDQYIEGMFTAYGYWSDYMADIYVQLIALHNEEAAEEETEDGGKYDSYIDYAYENVFQRDYTPEEILPFIDAVKENLPALSADFDALAAVQENPYAEADFTGDIAFDMIEPYVKEFSPEMAEAFTYMRDHHLYNYDNTTGKDGSGFTTILPLYGAPYTFNTPTETLYDFTTAVHEFGHYDRYYWIPTDFFEASDSIDLAEVHSQGFELLFTQYYEDIFGEYADAVENYVISNLLYAMISGCMEDEFQRYAFTEEDLTAEKLEAKYAELLVEYGMFEEGDPNLTLNSLIWFRIPHNFSSPMYYISYAVSAAGAFSFWLDAQENGYDDANLAYRTLVSLEPGYTFKEALEVAGVDDPTTPEYVEDLTAALTEAVDPAGQAEAIEEQARQEFIAQMEPVFADVSLETEPDYAEYIWYAYAYGLVGGIVNEDGELVFDGDASFTRSQAVSMIHNGFSAPHDAFEIPFTDVPENAWYANALGWAYARNVFGGTSATTFSPDDVITEEQYVTAMYNMWLRLNRPAVSADVELPYADAGDISPWAKEAMVWAATYGLIDANEAGNVEPQMPLTRLDGTLFTFMLYTLIRG